MSNQLFMMDLPSIKKELEHFFEQSLKIQIERNGILFHFRYLSKQYPLIEFNNIPLCISKIIQEYLFYHKEIELFLHLFVSVTPFYRECFYLYWYLEKKLTNKILIQKYNSIIKNRNKNLMKNKYGLFYYNSLDMKKKNLKDEIISFIYLIQN